MSNNKCNLLSMNLKCLSRFFLNCLILFLCSCGSIGKLSHQDFVDEISSSESALQADLLIFNSDSIKSCLFLHVPDQSALFMRDSDMFISKLKVSYEMHLNYESKAIVDSGSKLIVKSSLSNSDQINDSLVFPMRFGNKYIMKITIKDLNRNATISRILSVNKTSTFTRQNFMLLNLNSEIQYRNYISNNEHFKLWSSNDFNERYFVRCYFRKYPLATPPFKVSELQIFNYKADSIFTVLADSVSLLTLNRFGFYYFQVDTNRKDGFTIFQYNSDFPLVTNSLELVEATRYLTSNSEFKELITAKDKKSAIDNFWIKLGGNKENARELIRTYYSRVQKANKNFSSYMDGWKTDRGMIYIIFGSPSTVYKDDESEYWNYTNQLYIPDQTFVFKRVANPFTDNDYSLIRQPMFDSPYFMAVDQWRQGRIANDK